MGHEINLPIDLIVPNPDDVRLMLEVNDACVLQERLAKAHEHASSQIKKTTVWQKRLYDMKVCPTPYKRGDFVWLYLPFRPKGIIPKLQKSWTVPFLIMHKLCDALYRIERLSCTLPKDLWSWISMGDSEIEI